MSKRLFTRISVVCIIMSFSFMLTACSLIPKKSNANNAEDCGKEYINEQVSLVDNKCESEKDSYGIKYYYHLQDERGIDFNVIVTDSFVTFVEGYIHNVYSDYLKITTNYKSKIMEYYIEDIEQILSKLKLEEDYKLTQLFGDLTITVSDEESLENIASAIMEIDNLLSYNYKLDPDTLTINRGNQTYWEHRADGTIFIKMKDSNTDKTIVYQRFEFSDGNNQFLTYDRVLKTLEANRMSNESEEEYYFVCLNDTLYYGMKDVVDEDDINIDWDNSDSSDYDGVMKRYETMLPQKNGYGNVGAQVPYKFGADGEVYLFMSDGCRVLREF